MELDAFTSRLGLGQGRVVGASGEVTLVLGDLEPGRRAELFEGDRVEIVQPLDVTGVALVRAELHVRAPTEVPPDLAWEVSVLVDGAPAARVLLAPGRTRALRDLAANVSKLSGVHEAGVRLALVRRP